ncbi:MAG: hypothetical protein WC183_03515 [Methanosarcina sp.]|jgi:hypothetical protein
MKGSENSVLFLFNVFKSSFLEKQRKIFLNAIFSELKLFFKANKAF